MYNGDPIKPSTYHTSEFPSLDIVEISRSLLYLVPIGPLFTNPFVVAISDTYEFLYSEWVGSNDVVDPATGFSDWKILDLGGAAIKVGMTSTVVNVC